MIESTFLHLPSVGQHLERRLWKAGYHNLDTLWRALASGIRARDCLRDGRQKRLFHDESESSTSNDDPLTLAWIDRLDQSRVALEKEDYSYFLRLLRPAHHWRVLPAAIQNAVFLDIETTGLSRDHHYITVIGALYHGRFHQWTWPQATDGLSEIIQSASVIVTFNGTRFDLPFLRRQIPAIACDKPHIDLLHVARAAGVRGGQKDVEVACGILRSQSILGFGGEEAVSAWCAGLYGSDKQYRKLLRYNKADVVALPEIAYSMLGRFYERFGRPLPTIPEKMRIRSGHRPSDFIDLRAEWRKRMPSFQRLRRGFHLSSPATPVVVGIDLRAKTDRPTGWTVCRGTTARTEVLFTDKDIIDRTLSARPDLVSIDAPLSLPRGRFDVSDDSPCRAKGGIVRDAERILWSRHIRVYPALIRQMQGLTARGIALTRELESHGLRVIESYPGAAQDVLNIPRKKHDQLLLEEGLRQFGYRFKKHLSHDELDAITSAMVGHFYLADQYEAIGADDEGYMINPISHGMRWEGYTPRRTQAVVFVGLPGAGKTTVTKLISQRFGWNRFLLGEALRTAAESDQQIADCLSAGDLAPEDVVCALVTRSLASPLPQRIFVDGFPRHADQLHLLSQLDIDWKVVYLAVPQSIAAERLRTRKACGMCRHVCSSPAVQRCPICGASEWKYRSDDQEGTLDHRLALASEQLNALLVAIPPDRLAQVNSNQAMSQVCGDVARAIDA